MDLQRLEQPGVGVVVVKGGHQSLGPALCLVPHVLEAGEQTSPCPLLHGLDLSPDILVLIFKKKMI